MKRSLFLAAGVCAAALVAVAPGAATTNQPATFTVRVTIMDSAIDMSPNHAARGSSIIFVLTNRGRKTHKFTLGDVRRGAGRTIGFSRTLAPSEQKRIVMYLDIRGLLHYRTVTGSKIVAKGIFKVT